MLARWMIVAAGLAFLPLSLTAQEVVQEPLLSERFPTPEQGVMRFRHTLTQEFAGLKVETVDDVIQLHEKIDALNLTPQQFEDGQWYRLLGIEKIPRKLPPPPPLPPGSKAENVITFPEWRAAEVVFRPNHIVQRDFMDDEYQGIYAETPQSSLDMSITPRTRQIRHDEPGGQRFYYRNQRVLLSREKDLLDRTYTTKKLGQRELITVPINERFETLFLVDPNSDSILARILAGNSNRVGNFTLHFQPQLPNEKHDISIPSYSIEFRGTGGATCRTSSYVLTEVDFNTPVEEKQLQVPGKKGDLYVDGNRFHRFSTRLPFDIEDVSALTPMLAQKLIQSEQRRQAEERRKQLEAGDAEEEGAEL